ncbi:unnamed protein product [Spodoptera littoralis]|uniref:Uncharacterized protein n=1 Tax=Spodoptera littoralis TaxID=7109 RepID=A0A9P0HWQ1_SPOLI|nr:unnamed protein product [Spodoptera littoralis]CAH1636783.1 unnamed protein product [Spodoptera littoralis]
MALTPAEKQRRYREKLKQDPVKLAEAKSKHLQRYHATKKLVKDMTEREHRSAKRKWKMANRKRRERQKSVQVILDITPASTPRSGTPVSPSSRGRRKVRRDRSALYRQNKKLEEENEKLKRKCNKYKKRYQRQKGKNSENGHKKYIALSNAIKNHYSRIKKLKERLAIRRIFDEDIIKDSRLKTSIVQETLGINKLKNRQTIPKQATLIKKIRQFFDRDDVSRITAGKRETVTYKKNKAQKRYLLDTMKNLFISFKKENPIECCSYSYFTKHRPFYVKPPAVDGRDTCQCKTHTNTQYMLNALYRNKIIAESNMTQIVEKSVCATDNELCMTGECESCNTNATLSFNTENQSRIVKYQQWVRRSEVIDKSGKKVKITKSIKEIITSSVAELIEKFKLAIQVLKKHIYNIKMQYRSYRLAIDDLKNDEALLHVDFSENYNGKYFEEIQHHHFGGSRQQITLHTGVLYIKRKEAEKAQVTSFCSVSPNNSHNPASIWAHLHPVISTLKVNHPHIKTIHVFSDGPATQYRQKVNFYFICSKTFVDYGFDRITWNFFEAGHGKGAADGVGGYLKRTADQKVATGFDIPDAETFFHTLKDSSKIQLYYITNDDIQKVEQAIPHGLIPLRGTMQVHQVFSDTPGLLQYRDLSCFCQRGFCACFSPQTYQPLPVSTSPISPTKISNNLEIPFDLIPERDSLEYMNELEVLTDISNIVDNPKKFYYESVYSPISSSDDELLSQLKIQQEASVSNTHDRNLIEKENVHPTKIFSGVYVIVKVSSDKDKLYY